MTTFDIEAPEVEGGAVALAPRAPRPVKGRAPKGPTAPLEDRLEIGGPVWRPLTVGGKDAPDPRGFLTEELAGFDFYLGHLTATFSPAPDEPFKEALVQIELDNPAGEGSIAWSLAPDRLEDVVQLSRQVTLNATLQITALAPVQPGVEAGWTRGKTVEKKQAFLLGGNELRRNPRWQFRETDGTPMQGMVRLVLVVRAPEGSETRGTVTVSAAVQQKRWGVFPFDAQLDPESAGSFVLGQATG
jgi:hypothetical protein